MIFGFLKWKVQSVCVCERERERDEQIERIRELEKCLSKTNIWSFTLSLVWLHTNSHFFIFLTLKLHFNFIYTLVLTLLIYDP